MQKKFIYTLCLFLISIPLFAQKKTLLKLEFPVAMHSAVTITRTGQEISVMYPTLYVPVHKHLDIGASYNNQKLNYFVSEKDLTDLSIKFYKGEIKYKVTSFYLKINLSASQKRANPFFGYILSLVKGDYTAPSRDSTSNFYRKYNYNATNNDYGPVNFSYATRMTPSEEAVLKKSLNRSQIAHGLQLGLDYKILPFLNLFIKTEAFSLAGSYSSETRDLPFSIYYKGEGEYKSYQHSVMNYYMLGIILKIDGGKKSLIK